MSDVNEHGRSARPASGRRGPSKRKRHAILGAARELFLDQGFAATSMEEVAARAGVAKQTVYSHFTDKGKLFEAIIETDIGMIDDPDLPLAAAMPDTDDVERDLTAFAQWHLATVLTPERLRLRRMLIGEAERFPHLARAWYMNGPELSCSVFASWFDALDSRGVLEVPDAHLAAQMFNWLVLSIPLNRAMALLEESDSLAQWSLKAIADEAVRVFLAAYRPGHLATIPS